MPCCHGQRNTYGPTFTVIDDGGCPDQELAPTFKEVEVVVDLEWGWRVPLPLLAGRACLGLSQAISPELHMTHIVKMALLNIENGKKMMEGLLLLIILFPC